ncbi:MAG TPA: ATP-binding protein [Flavobacteriaceae bacterium]|nr:ATP-binding protein [Flavobacteriaceae bacterium]
MRDYFIILVVFFSGQIVAQNSTEATLVSNYKACKDKICKALKAFQLSEYFLETDEIDKAQQWLDSTKTAHFSQETDVVTAYIHSMQSELFYYMGLYQFGEYEAQKDIEAAIKLQDSALIADAWFFKGINQIELGKYPEAEQALHIAKTICPQNRKRTYLRSIINKEHVYNNLALLKLKMEQLDSAHQYNALAYKIAKKEDSKRGIPNCEQLFGLIYLAQKQLDSATVYLQKSNLSAQNSQYFDIELINQAYLMQCYPEDKNQIDNWFNKGLKLMETYTVNNTFKRYFFSEAIKAYQDLGDTTKQAFIQEDIIELEKDIRLKGNYYIQNITKQYVENENKLLSLKIEEFERQRSISFLQTATLILCLLVLLLAIVILRRKNRIQKTLMHQKNEISKDLHDDIGSGLSSILIHTDLLLKSNDTPEPQKKMLAKIAGTGKDISQRLNAFIWSLNTEHNNLRNFCEYLKQYSNNLFEGTEINFYFHQDIDFPDHIAIQGDYRKNLFFCVKELLNNTLKHANATEVKLEVLLEGKHALSITLQDNGSGITKSNSFGNGLKNVTNRIENMKGKVTFENNKGLEVQIKVPI